MKKTLITLAAIAFSFVAVSNASAAAYDQDTDTFVVTVIGTNVNNAPNIVFGASSQVIVDGESEATAFAHAAYHKQVEDKKNGRQFAMHSDVSTLYWLDISAEATGNPVYDVPDTKNTFTTTNKWSRM